MGWWESNRRYINGIDYTTVISVIASMIIGIIISWIVNSDSHKIYNQNGYEIAQKLRNNVVQIRAIFTGEKIEDGFGFIVGERKNNLYVVTAHHVVSSDDPDVKIEKIEAQFYQSKGKIYKADLLALSYPGLDIALLEIPKPEGYNWEKKYFCSQPETNDKVWFIGRNRDWYIPSDAATGSINRKSPTGEIYVDMRSVQPGTSGAPLITKKGIVGMIIIDSGNEVTALNIGIIQNTVTQEWNYPWNLEAFQDVTK